MNSSFFLVLVAAVLGIFMIFRKFRFKQDNKDTKSSLLSPPSSSSLSRIWNHDVFPSFHGADVRKTILSHILEVFRRKGIDSFIDNDIKKGTSIGPELIEAIRGSKIKIVLLSRNYASSSWCLDELAEIMNCREVLGHLVMTIFYEVYPTDIKKQTGDFGKAFRRTCKGKTKEHIGRWRKALEDVAQIAGEHSRNWVNEAAMIEKIATDVSNILNSFTPSRDFEGLVGMRAHMERMEELLSLDLDEVRMIGIWGPPGIGKTTIARFLFNQVSGRFQHGTIMVNVKACYPTPCLDEFSVQLQLQNQMLSQVINHKGTMISHLEVAQERLKDKKVFLVLDDVDRVGQLDALAKETQWFGPGSRIIITTEDVRVLNAHRIKHIYKVNCPSSDEALQIFCMHAFGKKHPDDGFYKLAKEVTTLVGKLPLGLKVLGSALRGMSKQEWERRLPRLKTRLNGEIESIIKFSFDNLEDEEKYLFLYIACLYSFQVHRKVEELLAKQIEGVRQSIDVLAEKSLISIGTFGEIEMHTLLVQFGIKTSFEQFVIHGHVKRHLLVGERDICEVLSGETTDSRRFIGINLYLSKIEEELNISEKAIERMSDLQFVQICGYNERLHSLLNHSQKIRSLKWMGFRSKCLPSTFNPEFLVELDMSESMLQRLWKGNKPLTKLKWMDLSFCSNLTELPDLSTATNLEELILEYCSSLLELPSSIANATNLKKLDLSYCSNLVELPSIGIITKLEELNLSGCSRLVKLPTFENATNLKRLELKNCSSLLDLPHSIGTATKLRELNLRGCSSLVKLPSSIGDITNLKSLNLSNCSSLVELPSSIGTATKLWKLDISGCSSLVKLPSSIGDITNLKRLDLSNCSSLVDLPSSIGNLQQLRELRMCGCSKLEALPTNINLESLQLLDLTNCSQLKFFPEISTNIRSLSLIGTAIKEVPLSIMSWPRLDHFSMSYFESLKEFPHALDIITELHLNEEDIQEVPSSIANATNLKKLDLSNCSNLVELPSSIGNITKLEELNLSGCSRLVKLPTFENATNLKRLELTNCSSLVKLPSSITDITNLMWLELANCSSLLEIPPAIGTATKLWKLNISGCSSLVDLPSSIGNLQQLYELRMCGCSKLEALPTNINLESLQLLDLTNCSQLKFFPGISTNIMRLILVGTSVKEVHLSIMSWPRLDHFSMSYFESLKEFPHAFDMITELHLNEDIQEVPSWVKGMSRLCELRLKDCNNLVSLPQFSDSLWRIEADNCKSLERLDCSFNHPDIHLHFTNCFKLKQEARDIIMHTLTSEYAVLPGTQVPACFDYRATAGGPLTIKLNERHLSTSLKFKACIVLVRDNEEIGYVDKTSMTVSIGIREKTNDGGVLCRNPRGTRHIYRLLTEHIYTFEVEAEEVTSTELVFEFNTSNLKWKIGECGLYQI